MIIRDMFQDDINRQINGVIKVDQSAEDVVRQEVKEYIITKELKKHIITFFNFYDDSFITPTADIGVWISGFSEAVNHISLKCSRTYFQIRR